MLRPGLVLVVFAVEEGGWGGLLFGGSGSFGGGIGGLRARGVLTGVLGTSDFLSTRSPVVRRRKEYCEDL